MLGDPPVPSGDVVDAVEVELAPRSDDAVDGVDGGGTPFFGGGGSASPSSRARSGADFVNGGIAGVIYSLSCTITPYCWLSQFEVDTA